ACAVDKVVATVTRPKAGISQKRRLGRVGGEEVGISEAPDANNRDLWRQPCAGLARTIREEITRGLGLDLRREVRRPYSRGDGDVVAARSTLVRRLRGH